MNRLLPSVVVSNNTTVTCLGYCQPRVASGNAYIPQTIILKLGDAIFGQELQSWWEGVRGVRHRRDVPWLHQSVLEKRNNYFDVDVRYTECRTPVSSLDPPHLYSVVVGNN